MVSSWYFLSRRLAGRALMMRILSPRSVWTTTSILPECDRPKMMNRFSACECAGSGMVMEKNRGRLLKADGVLGQIGSGLVRVPFKRQHGES
jgi:hypothetical protein